ncbi:HAD family hydrolase [Ferruginibacter albus]|uniref:HAD family hydrolase n=1 Tax=Ferruginibacter albus TaxID=2875540 RepID=UPI001CC80A9E|nr:HAD family hydrolase [Ferruginibacter albus]UAY51304.1 haloacid dehalogenase-like hydrolase [Ferruginibacter albus]
MQKTIAFFDFDGTITTSDTMLELIQYCKGSAAYLSGMILLSPTLILMKAGIISKAAAKEKMLSHFFGNMPLNDFNEMCHRFIDNRLPSLIRPKAIEKIKEHLANNDKVVVVSASAENWIGKWCTTNGLSCLATKLSVSNNVITGKLAGANCNGEEKVNRIKAAYTLSDYSTIYCYGDTNGDKPMLALATSFIYKPFRN